MANILETLDSNAPRIFADRPDFQRQSNVVESPYQIVVYSKINSTGGDTSDGSGGRPITVRGWLPEQVNFDVSAQYEAPFAQGFNNYLPPIGTIARALGVSLVTQAMTGQVWQGSTEINFTLPIVFQTETSAWKDVIQPIKDLMILTMPHDPQKGGALEAPGPRITIEKLKKRVGEITLPQTPVTQQSIQSAVANLTNQFAPGKLGENAIAILEKVYGEVKEKVTSISGGLQSVLQSPASVLIPAAGNLAIDAVSGIKNGFNSVAVQMNKQLVNAIDNNISLYVGDFLYFPSVVITDVSQTYDVLIAPDKNPSRATVNVSFRTFYVPTDRDLEVMFPANFESQKPTQTLAGYDLTNQI